MARRVGTLEWMCVAFVCGCGSSAEVGTSVPDQPVSLSEEVALAAEPSLQVAPSYRADEFLESEGNRDPFRTFAEPSIIVCGGRDVRLRDTPVDAIRLIATVSGVASPIAMLTGADGVGQTVRRGDYVGADELVSRADMPYSMTWRVDSIEHDRLVLVRVDPVDGSRSSRVLAMAALERG